MSDNHIIPLCDGLTRKISQVVSMAEDELLPCIERIAEGAGVELTVESIEIKIDGYRWGFLRHDETAGYIGFVSDQT